MDESFAGALLALGDLPSAVQRLAAASSHWCRVMLLSAVYRLILLEAAFRSLLCSQSLVQAAQDAMMDCKDDYECGTVANAVGELVRGHGANKAAFSCEATCIGLARMAEAAVEQVTVQVDALELLSPCFCVRVVDSNTAGCRVLDIQHFPSQSLNSQIRLRLQGSLLSVRATLRSRRRCLQRHALPSNICALPPRRLSRSRVDSSVEQVCVAIQSFFDCRDQAADSQSCRNIRANLPKVNPFFVLPCATDPAICVMRSGCV